MADELVRTAPPATASKPAQATTASPPSNGSATLPVAAAVAADKTSPSPNAGLGARPKQAGGGAGGTGGAGKAADEAGVVWEEEQYLDNIVYLIYK